MAKLAPSPAGFFRGAKLVLLLLFHPERFLELQAEDSARLSASPNSGPAEGVHVVRRAFFSSLALVAASASVGYIVGAIIGRAGCAPPSVLAWLQILGASLLLWGTLFIRGWEIQTYGGATLTERVNQWIYRTLYCLGTAVVVFSLAWPQCK